jgi:hypothetical protein
MFFQRIYLTTTQYFRQCTREARQRKLSSTQRINTSDAESRPSVSRRDQRDDRTILVAQDTCLHVTK